ncbi:MAG: hypothetical protein RL637_646 [Pseudomonadota bacterium]|jgi:tetratricopeptide (TPR) repeat protein
MSIIDLIKKKSALKNAIQQVTRARHQTGENADRLFESAYQGFEMAIHKELMISDSLYHWGFALLHQAKTKTGHEAIKLYQEAIQKFNFCRIIDPEYLGAAIDGGVAYMDLARLKQVSIDDELYRLAQEYFEIANRIHKGTASYNIACIYSLFNQDQACEQALLEAQKQGSLPSVEVMLNDPDLKNMQHAEWFKKFIDSLSTAVAVVSTTEESTNSTE